MILAGGRREDEAPPAHRRRLPPAGRAFAWWSLALLVLHAVDERLWHRPAGVHPHGPSALIVVLAVLVLLAVVIFRLPLLPRFLVLITMGIPAAAGGVMHLLHAAVAGPGGADVSGVVAGVGGVVLVACGVVEMVVGYHSGRGSRRAAVVWSMRLGAGLVCGVVGLFVVVPVVVGVVLTHTPVTGSGRWEVPGAREVAFTSSDGLHLRGKYAASTNGAAVVLISSARGDRSATARHARLLAAAGYGVLGYDARGTGSSEGDPNGYGWAWVHDVAGAVTFLQRQPDVEPGRIGVLGLSTGADVALEAAAQDRRIRAVVSDGATGRSVSDIAPRFTKDPTGWVYAQALFAGVRISSVATPGAPLVDLVPWISPTPLLLVAAGSLPLEMEANRRYAAAAKEPVSLWELPNVDHTAALEQVPTRYKHTVVGFFDGHLQGAAHRPGIELGKATLVHRLEHPLFGRSVRHEGRSRRTT